MGKKRSRKLEFYSNLFANWISDGKMINRQLLSSIDMRPLYDRVATKHSIKRVIAVYKFPIDYDKILTKKINDMVFKADKNCKVIFTNALSRVNIMVNSDMFRRQMAKIERDYREYASVLDSMSDTEKAIGGRLRDPVSGRKIYVSREKLMKIKESYDSYKYTYDTVKNGGSMFTTFYFIEVIAPTDDSMNTVMKLVTTYLEDNDFGFKSLKNNMSLFLNSFGPASYPDPAVIGEFADMLFSSENLTCSMPYKCRGHIGDGTGAIMGVDLGPKGPLVLNFFKGGARQVNILCAPSGHGKTIAAFQAALGILATGVHVSALDIKGNEWNKLKAFTDYIEIDISEDSPRFVNTLRLDDIACPPSEASKFYNMAKTATVTLMSIMCDPQPETKSDVEAILTSAVNKTFSLNGVYPNAPQSFKNSAKLTYRKVLEQLEELKAGHTYKYKDELITEMRARIAKFVINSDLLKGVEISIAEIIDKPLVIYSLNKNTDSNITMEDSLRSFLISYVDMKKISIRKMHKQGTACFYEELQRKNEFKALINFICGVVTGARSSNVAVFLLLNTIRVLEDKDMAPIVSNLSTYIMGPVQSDKDYEFMETLNCKEILPLVRKISDNAKSYRNTFAIQVDTGESYGATLYKPLLPDEIMDKLKTRDEIA